MKFLKWAGILVGTLLVLVVLFLGWLGFMPWLSNYIGPKPRDMGVEMTVENAYSAAEAMNIPTTTSKLEAILADPDSAKRLDATVTDDEVSSLLAMGQTTIPDWPLRRVQVRFNDDGTAEASGVLVAGELPGFLSGLGVPQSEIDVVYDRVPVLRGNVVVYAAGACSVSNNTVDLALSEIQVGRITIPADWYQGKESYGTKYIDGALASNGFQIDSLTIGGDGVTIKGTQPLSAMEPYLHIVTADAGGE
ncbi:MAG: hypothetical protein Kow0056_07960 [Coriobacteriia bacterium]